MGIQGNYNSFFTCYFKVALDRFFENLESVLDYSISHYLLLNRQEEANIQIANTTIKCSKSNKLLGIVLDNKLKFDKHIENICEKVSKKLNALARVTNYMGYLKDTF